MSLLDLEHRTRLWRRHRRFQRLLTSAASGAFAAAIMVRFSALSAAVMGAIAAATAWFVLSRKSAPIAAATVAAHLDRACPPLEESTSLWLRDHASLSLLERLQLGRVDAAWSQLPDRAEVGNPRARGLRAAGVACAAAVILLTALAIAPRPSRPRAETAIASPAVSIPPARITLRSGSLFIEPPAYLGAAARRSETLDAEVPEGARVTWELVFDGPVQAVGLVRADGEISPPVEALGGGRFRARTTLAATLVYQVETTSVTDVRIRNPQVHVLKIIRDLPPRIAWTEPAIARTILTPADPRTVRVQIDAGDDYGISQVELVATLAKGSGEGVKFRERTLPLQRGASGANGLIPFSAQLDLAALGLELGDELYVHALAQDHRSPVPNLTRSENRFFVLQGPAAALTDPAVVATGVKRMPQFFRSQRQLIIDTEQLLAEQPNLTPEKFQQRSDEIGIDQKLLRLRYGQFLGEEFEPTSAGAPTEAEAMGFAARLRGGDRNAAARDAAISRAVEAQHDHPTPAEGERRPATVESMAAPYVHRHDSPEAATIFDPKVKATLRAVLAAMWEAEGFLRGGRPAEALPAENRALAHLKELQQADRVYVARTGFEPAPINLEQRRLRGELEAIPARAAGAMPVAPDNPAAEALRAILALAELGGSIPTELADQVEAQLSRAVQERPELYIPVLERWRRRTEGLKPDERQTVRRALLSLLPPAQPRPERPSPAGAALERAYFDQLSGKTAERAQ